MASDAPYFVNYNVLPLGETDDIERDRASLNAILTALEAPDTDPVQLDFSQFGPSTPWLAHQLGICAEFAIQHNELAFGARVAYAAMTVGRFCNSLPHFLSNIITYGNLLVMAGDSDEAIQALETVLSFPQPEATALRFSALTNLAGLLIQRGQAADALSILECSIPNTIDNLNDTDRTAFLQSVLQAAAEAHDFAFLIFCTQHLEKDKAPSLYEPLIEALEKRPMNLMMQTTTRLRILGLDELASQIKARWIRHNQQKKTSDG